MDKNVALEALMTICGGKAQIWLNNITTYVHLNEVRNRILDDYSYNSFSLKGVNCLHTVLTYLSEQTVK